MSPLSSLRLSILVALRESDVLTERCLASLVWDSRHLPGALKILLIDGGGSDEMSVSLSHLVRMVGNGSMNIAINQRCGKHFIDTLNGLGAINPRAGKLIGLRENAHTIEQEKIW